MERSKGLFRVSPAWEKARMIQEARRDARFEAASLVDELDGKKLVALVAEPDPLAQLA